MAWEEELRERMVGRPNRVEEQRVVEEVAEEQGVVEEQRMVEEQGVVEEQGMVEELKERMVEQPRATPPPLQWSKGS